MHRILESLVIAMLLAVAGWWVVPLTWIFIDTLDREYFAIGPFEMLYPLLASSVSAFLAGAVGALWRSKNQKPGRYKFYALMLLAMLAGSVFVFCIELLRPDIHLPIEIPVSLRASDVPMWLPAVFVWLPLVFLLMKEKVPAKR